MHSAARSRRIGPPLRTAWPGHSLEDDMSTQADHGHELIPRPVRELSAVLDEAMKAVRT